MSLFIDTSTLDIPGVFGIDAASVKIASGGSFVGASLFDAPGDVVRGRS